MTIVQLTVPNINFLFFFVFLCFEQTGSKIIKPERCNFPQGVRGRDQRGVRDDRSSSLARGQRLSVSV